MTWVPVYVDDGGRPGYAATRAVGSDGDPAHVVVLYDHPQGERAMVKIASRRSGRTLAATELDRDAVAALRDKLDRVLERMDEADRLRGLVPCGRGCGAQVFHARDERMRPMTMDAEPVPEGASPPPAKVWRLRYAPPGHPDAEVTPYRLDRPIPEYGRFTRHECKGGEA